MADRVRRWRRGPRQIAFGDSRSHSAAIDPAWRYRQTRFAATATQFPALETSSSPRHRNIISATSLTVTSSPSHRNVILLASDSSLSVTLSTSFSFMTLHRLVTSLLFPSRGFPCLGAPRIPSSTLLITSVQFSIYDFDYLHNINYHTFKYLHIVHQRFIFFKCLFYSTTFLYTQYHVLMLICVMNLVRYWSP